MLYQMARQEGFEPPTYCLEGSCSILLSYWGRYINFFRAPRESEESYRRGWDGGTRTHYIGVKVRCVTITLHPIISYEPRPAAPASIILYMGWDMGLEPTTTGITILDSTN